MAFQSSLGQWSLSVGLAPRQTNGLDCGVFMLQYARAIALSHVIGPEPPASWCPAEEIDLEQVDWIDGAALRASRPRGTLRLPGTAVEEWGFDSSDIAALRLRIAWDVVEQGR
eukprot:COSAG05_NODE_951_length_6466_cov_130.129417_3_plen_113_part_00